ncbi:MAG: hypothetical protein M3Y34_07695, partial [Actinomycetota bacterium]|nr:hypothetical protein [Actinomycetota bacterium]
SRSGPPRGLASGGRGSKPPSRYSLFVGIAFVALIVVALFNLIGTEETGILGAGEREEGLALAEFAVPDARGSSDADANVFQDDCESSRNPCPDDQVRVPACEIEAEDAIRVCDLFDRPLALSFWFTRGGDCLPSQDAFDRAAERYGDRVNFLSVNVRDERETVTGIIDERGWSLPVGLDPDGAVSNLYRVGVCPTIAFAYPGGILHRAVNGTLTQDELESRLDGLLAATRRRAERSR